MPSAQFKMLATLKLKYMKQKIIKPLSFLLLLFFLLVGLLSLRDLSKELAQSSRIRRAIPFVFLGYKFAGLDQFLKNEKYVGYYTDGDTKDAGVIEEYSQAQFVLAPHILDLNNTSRHFTIFNCSNETVALKKIQELGLRPFKRNNLGIIVARTP